MSAHDAQFAVCAAKMPSKSRRRSESRRPYKPGERTATPRWWSCQTRPPRKEPEKESNQYYALQSIAAARHRRSQQDFLNDPLGGDFAQTRCRVDDDTVRQNHGGQRLDVIGQD